MRYLCATLAYYKQVFDLVYTESTGDDPATTPVTAEGFSVSYDSKSFVLLSVVSCSEHHVQVEELRSPDPTPV